MPRGTVGEVLGKQLLRSGTSVGANYRAACRAKSRADMLSKLGTVEEEADETLYWLEMVVDAGLFPSFKVSDLLKEGEEILSMIVASRKTLRMAPPPQSEVENQKSKIAPSSQSEIENRKSKIG